jgi:hypothetical protein
MRIELDGSALDMFVTRDYLLRLRDQITATCENPRFQA